MHVGNQRCCEIRGFTTTGYYQGSAGNMPGGPVDLFVSVLCRPVAGATTEEVLFENMEDLGGGNEAGWSVSRSVDASISGNTCAVFNFDVFGGASGNIRVTANIPRSMVLGRLTRIDCFFDESADTAYIAINAQQVESTTDGAVTAIAASTAPTIGARRGNTLPATNTAILEVGYLSGNEASTGYNNIDDSYVQGLKRANLEPTADVVYAHRYSARTLAGFAGKNGAGYPRTLADIGDTGGEDMLKQGAAALTVGTPQVLWATAVQYVIV